MKAMVVSPVGGRVPPTRGVLHNGLGLNGGGNVGVGEVGGVGNRRDMEAEEVAAYLTKLRSLVPDMPRKRKLSKLEVIQRVIEYICDLQTTLEETNAPSMDKTKTSSTSTSISTTSTTSTSQIVNNDNSHNNNCNILQQQQQRQPLNPHLNSTSSSASMADNNDITSSTTNNIVTTTNNEVSSLLPSAYQR